MPSPKSWLTCDAVVYEAFQAEIRRIADLAGVPPIAFDYLAWDAGHQQTGEIRKVTVGAVRGAARSLLTRVGYKNVEGDHGKKIIVPDPDLAPMVVRLFELYSRGDRSVKELARIAGLERLNRHNLSRPLATATVHKILRNRIYSGEFEWAGKVFRGVHAPLLPKRVGTLSRKCWTGV